MEKKRGKNQTGGSTGSPLQFYVDMERFDSRKASTLRHDLWAGLRPGDWRISLWGSRLDQARAERHRSYCCQIRTWRRDCRVGKGKIRIQFGQRFRLGGRRHEQVAGLGRG